MSSETSTSNTGNDFDLEHNKNEDRPNIIRWKSGKMVDPKLLELLESFRELYVKRRKFFKKIFPVNYEESVEVFKKLEVAIRKNKKMKNQATVKRSLSFGDESNIRLERFKIKTPVVIVAGPNGQDKNGQENNGSNNSG